jgi:hypothetical protein
MTTSLQSRYLRIINSEVTKVTLPGELSWKRMVDQRDYTNTGEIKFKIPKSTTTTTPIPTPIPMPVHSTILSKLEYELCKSVVLSSILINVICQGFTKLHSGSGLNGLRPQGLKEYSDSYLFSDYLRLILGSK